MGRNVSALIGKSVPHIPEKCNNPGTFCVPCIIGRPFLKIAQTKIDVYDGTLSMEFGDIVVHFNILDAMKFPSEAHSIFHVELIDDLVDEHIHDFDSSHVKKHSFLFDLYNFLSCVESESEFEYEYECEFDYDEESEFDTLGAVPLGLDFMESKCTNHVAGSTKEFDLQVEVQATEPLLLPSLAPSDVQLAPTPELKPLPKTLKYAYLEDDERFPVIISTSLDANQEERCCMCSRSTRKQLVGPWLTLLALAHPHACTGYYWRMELVSQVASCNLRGGVN
uniref:Reverse transcriptase domain-containing protein n=1 Tax=Cajanus cajan TaxID=3821 RepID=A0A151RRC8_CAJCA|nr:hypothetical protein KK1_033387 [Cajanus cajan]